ncbi:MAG: lipid-A-disaccharide synthase [Pseudomonadota bacterium]
MATAEENGRRRLFVIAGEASGDALGADLIRALRRQDENGFEIAGIGGDRMIAEGIDTPFHVTEVSVMGIFAIAAALPRLVKRVHEVVDHAIAFKPDAVVIIDSPEFTHPIAHRIRKRLPDVPIVDYVSPSVWAWRSYRARKMVGTIDKVLGLLPFEPAAYEALSGPPCVYVGHPLIERLDEFTPDPDRGTRSPKTALILPGSRSSEINRLLPIFKEAVHAFDQWTDEPIEWVLPAVPQHAERIKTELSSWTVPVTTIIGRDEHRAAFRKAHLAIAASGTVTLELALARVPMVVCYRIDIVIAAFRSLLRAHSVVLPNLIAGGNTIPELIHKDCTVENILDWMKRLWTDTPDRKAQMAVFQTVEDELRKAGPSPSSAAADEVIKSLQ